MTILATDIKLLETERMSDASDGGGRRTARAIPDGVAGNVFPKISRVDSVYGRVNLRKVVGHVATSNLDMYAGAHFVITDAPDNDRIHVTAFSTASDFDTRLGARDRIESYVIAGPVSRMTLYGRQLLGSQAVLVYQRPTEPLPEIGDIYALSNETGGTTLNQQFVRISDVAAEKRTFTDGMGDFDATVVTLKISAPLRYEFAGPASPVRQSDISALANGRLRSTTVADASRYVGIMPLSAVATVGALELSVSSVYAPLVPTTQRETPLSLASTVGAEAVIPSATVRTPFFFHITIPASYSTAAYIFRLPSGVVPGTLRVRVSSFQGNALSYFEVPSTGIVAPSSNPSTLAQVYSGSLSHTSGALSLSAAFQGPGESTLSFSYIPAATVSQPAHTQAIPISLATRGTVYAIPLLPIPAPGTLLIDYRALGKWYRLRDDGTGELSGGDAQYGTGTVDYINGAITVTLGALPDVGSSIILSWGSPTHYEILTDVPQMGFSRNLAQVPVSPGTVVLTWMEGAVEKTATDSGTGSFTGDGTGTINYQTGAITLVMNKPIAGTVSITYSQYVAPIPVDAPPGLTYDYGGAIVPRSVTVAGVNFNLPNGTLASNDLHDDGVGNLRYPFSVMSSNYDVGDNIFGSVDYTTGVVTVNAATSVRGRKTWDAGGFFWQMAPPSGDATVTSIYKYSARLVSDLLTIFPKAETAEVGSSGLGLTLRLGPNLPPTIVPGSVLFSAFGKLHVDRNGSIYTDLQANGSGTLVGTIDYPSGQITINNYPSGTAGNLTILACLGRKGDYTAKKVAFRTAGSPLRPASLYVQVVTKRGTLLVGTTDQNGNVTGLAATWERVSDFDFDGTIRPSVTGVADQTTGVVTLEFNVPVLPGTLRYSAVVLSNLPLNADILGLDPTRLPTDGRAPIYRPADVAVIHHTDTVAVGTPIAGALVDAGRGDLSMLWLEDANKKKLDPALFEVDLPAGTATLATPLDLTGYAMPVVARHRIEEMLLLSDVQINGTVSTTAPLLREYPLGSYLSSALLFGDLQARVTNVFEQSTWAGEWKDTATGATPTAQFDDVNYPIEVLNNGTVTERWRIQFTSSTAFQVIGQNLGVIAIGSTTADLQPINSLTSLPYFTLRKNGWGLGWSVGNQLRFDTVGATAPIWLARTVLPGATLAGDSFDAQLRGDVD